MMLKRKVGLLSLMIFCGLNHSAQATPTTTTTTDWQLDKVVILSRHGVRAPTKDSQLMQQATPLAWPTWPVALGDLTPRGATLITLLGNYYRDYFQAQKLLPTTGCPSEKSVMVWADVDQRTRKTSQAFLAGLAPGCKIPVQHQAVLTRPDPLFDPLKAGKCQLEAPQLSQAIEQQAHMPIDQLNTHYAASLTQLGELLHFSDSALCQKTNKASCSLITALPTRLHIESHGKGVKLEGGMAFSSMVAEIFLLQYAEGMPLSSVAWGGITQESQWRTLFQIHNANFDLTEKTPEIARYRSTPLLHLIAQALDTSSESNSSNQIQQAQNASIVFIAGHDTNIANVAGALGLSWSLPQQPDNTPPGGALLFERWHNRKTQQVEIKINMVYQTLAQLRHMMPLSLYGTQPEIQVIPQPGCRSAGNTHETCELDQFMQLVKQQQVAACLPPQITP